MEMPVFTNHHFHFSSKSQTPRPCLFVATAKVFGTDIEASFASNSFFIRSNSAIDIPAIAPPGAILTERGFTGMLLILISK